MIGLINFVFFIIGALIQLMVWALIINAVISWLVAFEVINLRNRFVYSMHHFLESVTRPILAPFRRFVPVLGGVDVSPILAILVLIGIQRYLLPEAHGALIGLLGGGAVVV